MDRKTILQIDDDGISFENGLRKVKIEWDDIKQIDVYTSRWGKKVRVNGAEERFEFRTLGEVDLRGKEKGRMGFEKGEDILITIVERTGFERTKRAERFETYKQP